MHYHLENIQHEPTLEEMTTAAIKILQKEDKGFVLYIEGAFIDKAHHENRARLAIDETVELAKAVEAAVKLTNEEDTLIVVTADHSQPLVMNGYAKRGHDILGVTSLEQFVEQDERVKNIFNYNLKYTTLNYGNGPGFSTNIESDLKNNIDISKIVFIDRGHRVLVKNCVLIISSFQKICIIDIHPYMPSNLPFTLEKMYQFMLEDHGVIYSMVFTNKH